MDQKEKIFVAGHRGLVGSAIIRQLHQDGFQHIITKTRHELDLRNQDAVHHFFQTEKPDYVFLSAAKVGGIVANDKYPAEFIYDNMAIETHVIHEAYQAKVKRLMLLGTGCIYPKFANQPIAETELLTGPLEPTNQWYAIAKIAGIKMCEAYRKQYGFPAFSVMPCNIYGPGDYFHLENAHVVPSLLRKFHEAKINQQPFVDVWGTGKAFREFMHVDDLANACVFLMNCDHTEDLINIGYGEDISIQDLADIIKNVTQYPGGIKYDTSKPDGTPKKLLNAEKIRKLGWKPKISFEKGLQQTYQWYLENQSCIRT